MDAFEAALLDIWDADPAHDIAHIHRVWANVRTIAKGEAGPVDWTVLRAATVFHDLVNLPKDALNRGQASRLSADAADPVLQRLGLSVAQRDQIAHAIVAHSYSAQVRPETIEACILRDADRLDALGAIGIARMMSVTGGLGRPLYDPNDPFADARDLDDARWGLDHFETKLLRLPETMATKTGRRIAQDRVAFMRVYLAELKGEIDATSM